MKPNKNDPYETQTADIFYIVNGMSFSQLKPFSEALLMYTHLCDELTEPQN